MKGYLDQRAELADERAKLAALVERREDLREQLVALNEPSVLEARARELGLVRPGERAFRVRGQLEPPPPPPPEEHDDGGFLGWLTGIF